MQKKKNSTSFNYLTNSYNFQLLDSIHHKCQTHSLRNHAIFDNHNLFILLIFFSFARGQESEAPTFNDLHININDFSILFSFFSSSLKKTMIKVESATLGITYADYGHFF